MRETNSCLTSVTVRSITVAFRSRQDRDGSFLLVNWHFIEVLFFTHDLLSSLHSSSRMQISGRHRIDDIEQSLVFKQEVVRFEFYLLLIYKTSISTCLPEGTRLPWSFMTQTHLGRGSSSEVGLHRKGVSQSKSALWKMMILAMSATTTMTRKQLKRNLASNTPQPSLLITLPVTQNVALRQCAFFAS